MPKGRGSNKRRSKYQKDNTETLLGGALKLTKLMEDRPVKQEKYRILIWDKNKLVVNEKRKRGTKSNSET